MVSSRSTHRERNMYRGRIARRVLTGGPGLITVSPATPCSYSIKWLRCSNYHIPGRKIMQCDIIWWYALNLYSLMQDMLATVVLTTEDTYVGAMELAALRIVKVLSTVLCCTIFRSAVQNSLCSKVGYCPRQRRTAQHRTSLHCTVLNCAFSKASSPFSSRCTNAEG
jgi:hypothetical protein